MPSASTYEDSEDTFTPDLTENENHGELLGDAEVVDNVLLLDGDDDAVLVPEGQTIDFTGDLTIAACIYTDQLNT